MARLTLNGEGDLKRIVGTAMTDDDPRELFDSLVRSIEECSHVEAQDGLLVLAEYLARPDKLNKPGRFPELASILLREHQTRVQGYTAELVEVVAEAMHDAQERREPSGDPPEGWCPPGHDVEQPPPREPALWADMVTEGRFPGTQETYREDAKAVIEALLAKGMVSSE